MTTIPDGVLDAWDALSHAIDRVLTSHPANMTQAAEGLEIAQRRFDGQLRRAALRQKEGE